jgi:hypothetical protein
MALLLTLVGVTLSATLVPVALGQINSTRDADRREGSLAAAQAGLDVALGHIRAANDGAGAGVRSALPCGPLAGHVAGAGSPRYQVTVDYYATDPKDQSPAWLAANRIACTPNAGPGVLPGFVLLTALGTDRPSGELAAGPTRALHATYPIQVETTVTNGGLIRVYSSGGTTSLCLDGGAGSPAPGTNLQVRSCDPSGAGSDSQRFGYRANLSLVLIASRSEASPLGMCLDAGTSQAAGTAVQLKPCALTTTPQQQWFFTDSGNFETTLDGTTASGFCLNVQMPDTAGSFVVLGSATGGTCRQASDARQTLLPDPMIGSGAAGASSGQLVSFGQFSRCLEVTDDAVTATYLIASPCQQSPDPAAVSWSQRWSLPAAAASTARATGQLATDTPTGRYCLRSPGAPGPNRYVTVVPCSAAGPTPVDLTWTTYRNTGAFLTSYRIEDGYGNCLAPADPTVPPPDFHPAGTQTSKIVVVACGGTTLQKWNAPPNTLDSPPLRDVGEQ